MFIRSKTHPFGRQLSTATVRALIMALYVLYPLGCILQLIPEAQGGGRALDITGLLVMLSSLIAFAVLAGSSLQRQTQEPEQMLDERELGERNRAAFQAHSVFSGVVLLGIIYIMLATGMAANGKFNA